MASDCRQRGCRKIIKTDDFAAPSFSENHLKSSANHSLHIPFSTGLLTVVPNATMVQSQSLEK